MKFHHVGFLTENINKSLKEFSKLNYKKNDNLFKDQTFRVNIQFIKNSSNIIELIKPFKENHGLIKILKKKNFAYHFAYKVRKINQSIISLRNKGFKLIINPTPAIAFKYKKVAFLKMKNNFIIELIEL